MSNYTKISMGHEGRTELHDSLGLTGAEVNGEEIVLTAGDWLRLATGAKRQFFAGEQAGITYVCIQVREGSLEGFTAEDAVVF